MHATIEKIPIGAHPSLRIQNMHGILTRLLSLQLPPSVAKIGVVGLLIQTRSPPSQRALRPSCSPIPPRYIPHSTSSPSTAHQHGDPHKSQAA